MGDRKKLKAFKNFILENIVLKMVAVMVLGMLTVVISGCATNRVDIIDAGVLSLDQHAAGKVYIAWSDAYEDGDGFVVNGVLRRRDTVGLPIKAYVDITIQSPDGMKLTQKNIDKLVW